MTLKNIFNLGEIVTFKSHPLLYDRHIRGDGKLVPPFMVVTEVFFEDKKKKIVDTSNGEVIGERVKYKCVFFDDNKCEFKDVIVYESMLVNFTHFYISKILKPKSEIKKDIERKDRSQISFDKSLIDEVSEYVMPSYVYGNIVYFRTKKLEVLKKRISVKSELINGIEKKKETIQHVVNYSTPDFITCGYKKEVVEGLFYPSGEKKKIVPAELFKVKWFNPNQMKFSEQYLPKECFIDQQPFSTLVPHHKGK